MLCTDFTRPHLPHRLLLLLLCLLLLLSATFAAGVASELEVRTTEAEREAARVQQIAITRARAREDARLAVLLGRSPRAVWEQRIGADLVKAPGVVGESRQTRNRSGHQPKS